MEFLQRNSRFTIGYDLQRKRSILRDLKPDPGKPDVYVGERLGEAPYDAYGLITGVPNHDGNGYALAVAGTNTQATEAAGEFLADSNRFDAFLHEIQWDDQHALPFFELALKVVAVGGSSVSSQILSYSRR